jgi:restriction system protein
LIDQPAGVGIPKWHEFIDPVVRVLTEGDADLQDIYARVADRVGLSEEAKEERTNSARQPVYWNRIGWAITHAKIAGLVESPSRARYRLTDVGRERAASGDLLGRSTLQEYAAYQDYYKNLPSRQGGAPDTPAESDEQLVELAESSATPTERIDAAVDELNAALEDKVYTALHQIQDPYDFEHLVTEFVARMGYGSEFEITPRSGDLGIDGIVLRDRLGLDRVYVQAKRYKADHPVTAEAVRAFIGSLGLHRASAGVMITTSTFPRTSREEVARTHSTNIRLIDGRELAHLMVKYDIGVTVERTVAIKRLDSSQFFASDESA